MRRTTNNDIILCEEKEDLPMKKHPVIHYILILVLSGSFGALLSFLMMHNEETLVSSIQTFKTWFGETSAILHIAVCGVLALVSFLCLRRTRKMLSRLTPETEDEIYDWVEHHSDFTMVFSILCTISNFFFLGASLSNLQKDNILVSTLACLVFISITTWLEVNQVKTPSLLNPKFRNVDPLAINFSHQMEQSCDEAETFEMYRASYQSFKALKRLFLAAFAVCCMVQVFYPIGLLPFLLIAIFWAVHSLSYLFAYSKGKQAQ